MKTEKRFKHEEMTRKALIHMSQTGASYAEMAFVFDNTPRVIEEILAGLALRGDFVRTPTITRRRIAAQTAKITEELTRTFKK